MELNKIINGDAFELIKDIPDKSIDCVYTDIPYLCHFGGAGSSEISGRIEKKHKALKGIIDGVDLSILEECKRVLKKVNIFIWCSKQQLLPIMEMFKDYNMEILVWCKTNPQPTGNNTWLPDVEYCLYFRETGSKLNDGYDLKSKWFVSSINKKDKDLYDHPTIKPLDLVKRHLKHVTEPNSIVLDPFIGSGTTAAACKQIGRNYIGFEIDPHYYQIAIDRLNGITQVEKEAGIEQIKLF